MAKQKIQMSKAKGLKDIKPKADKPKAGKSAQPKVSKAAAKRAGGAVMDLAQAAGLSDDPNHPERPAGFELAEAGATCRFLGRNYGEGETICYRGKIWVCQGGAWDNTGAGCG